MQYFHKKNGKDKLVIFFLGWATDYSSFARLNEDGYDVLYVWDYRDKDFEPKIDLNAYAERILLSYSYGVFISSLIDIENISKNIAINGTLCPIDRTFGINPKMFDLTLKTLSDETLQKFYRNMFENETEYAEFKALSNKLGTNELKCELESIKKLAAENTDNKKLFDKAFISHNDKIIPTKSQFDFWKDKTEQKTIMGGHFPFIVRPNLKDYIE